MIQESCGHSAARTTGILKRGVSAVTKVVSHVYISNFVWFNKWLFEIIETSRKVFFLGTQKTYKIWGQINYAMF